MSFYNLFVKISGYFKFDSLCLIEILFHLYCNCNIKFIAFLMEHFMVHSCFNFMDNVNEFLSFMAYNS